MRMRRDIKRLVTYWNDYPPPHLALQQVRDIVIVGLGGEPPERAGAVKEYTSAEEWMALAVALG